LLAITFEPQTLDGQSRARKTWITAKFPRKKQSKTGSCDRDPGLMTSVKSVKTNPNPDVTHKNCKSETFQFKQNLNNRAFRIFRGFEQLCGSVGWRVMLQCKTTQKCGARGTLSASERLLCHCHTHYQKQ